MPGTGQVLNICWMNEQTNAWPDERFSVIVIESVLSRNHPPFHFNTDMVHWPCYFFISLQTIIFKILIKKKKDLYSLRLDISITKKVLPSSFPVTQTKTSSKHYRKCPYYSCLWVKPLKTYVERNLDSGIYHTVLGTSFPISAPWISILGSFVC